MTIHSLEEFLSQFGTSLLFMSDSNCCFLTCIEIYQEAGKVVWHSHIIKNFAQIVVIHTVKVTLALPMKQMFFVLFFFFLEFSFSFDDPTDVGNSIYGSSAFCKSRMNIWNFMIPILLKADLENFEYYFASM